MNHPPEPQRDNGMPAHLRCDPCRRPAQHGGCEQLRTARLNFVPSVFAVLAIEREPRPANDASNLDLIQLQVLEIHIRLLAFHEVVCFAR